MTTIVRNRRFSIASSTLAMLIACVFACVGLSVGPAALAEGLATANDRTTDAKSEALRVLTNERFSDQPGKAGLCDVYSPAGEPPSSGHPVVIVVHGGGWISGDKWTLEGYSRLLAKNGFVVVTINYRLAPTHKFPAQVDDVRQALLWTQENAERFALDMDRLGLFGYSAGGHLSTLVASLADEPIDVRVEASQWSVADPRWKRIPPIRAVCAGGPPCDFQTLPIDNTALAYFLGGSRRELPDVYAVASPKSHVTSADPTTQIIHGESDLIVPLDGSRQFHLAQVAAGVDSRLEVMPKQGHIVTFVNPKTSTKMLEFFREVLAEPH